MQNLNPQSWILNPELNRKQASRRLSMLSSRQTQTSTPWRLSSSREIPSRGRLRETTGRTTLPRTGSDQGPWALMRLLGLFLFREICSICRSQSARWVMPRWLLSPSRLSRMILCRFVVVLPLLHLVLDLVSVLVGFLLFDIGGVDLSVSSRVSCPICVVEA